LATAPTGLKAEYSLSGNAKAPIENVGVSGIIQTQSSILPKLVFLGEEGRDKFIAATELHAKKGTDPGGVYRWQVAISAQLFTNGGKNLEIWVYDKASNAFLKVDQGATARD